MPSLKNYEYEVNYECGITLLIDRSLQSKTDYSSEIDILIGIRAQWFTMDNATLSRFIFMRYCFITGTIVF